MELRRQARLVSEGAVHRWFGGSDVVAGQADVLPAERSYVAEDVVAGGAPFALRGGDSVLKVAGVPRDDGGDEQVEAIAPHPEGGRKIGGVTSPLAGAQSRRD